MKKDKNENQNKENLDSRAPENKVPENESTTKQDGTDSEQPHGTRSSDTDHQKAGR